MLDTAAAAAAAAKGIDWTTIFQTVFSGLLVILTLFYVLTTRRQLTTMEDTLKHSEDSAKKSNENTERSNRIASESLELGRRAWVVASKVERVSQTTWPPVTRITISNVGGVPASDVTVLTEFIIDPLPDPLVFGPQARQHPMGVLGNGCEDRFHETPTTPAASYLFLRIDYRDYFDKPRWTEGVWNYGGPDLQWRADAKHHRVDGKEAAPELTPR